jgi:hypothetical protein
VENAVLKLQRLLDEESSKRKRELETAKQLADSASKEEKAYLCRSWVVFLFANCEQFLKQTTFHYLSIVKEYDIERDLYPAWYILYGKQMIIDAKEDDKYIKPSKVNKNRILDDLLGSECSPKWFKKFGFSINTLRFFCDWVLASDMPYADWKLFCEALREKRNKIAHGEEAYADNIIDCEQWHDNTFKFMDELKADLVNALAKNF